MTVAHVLETPERTSKYHHHFMRISAATRGNLDNWANLSYVDLRSLHKDVRKFGGDEIARELAEQEAHSRP